MIHVSASAKCTEKIVFKGHLIQNRIHSFAATQQIIMASKKMKATYFSEIRSSKYPKGRLAETESDEEDEVIFFKQPSFFNKNDTFKFGNFKIKLAFHPTKFSWHCFLKKVNGMNRNSKYGDSFIIFPAQDIDFIIECVKKCARKVMVAAIHQDHTYGDSNPNAYKTQEFWHSEHSEIAPSNQLIIRPFTDSNGSYFVKFLSPKSHSEYEDWLGSSVSMNVPLCKSFLEILEMYKVYVENYQRNLQEQTHMKGKPDENPDDITLPSPTKQDICGAVKHNTGHAV